MDSLEAIKNRIERIEKTIRDLRTTQIEGHKTLVEHTTNLNVLSQIIGEMKTAVYNLQRFETKADTSYQYYKESKDKYERRLIHMEKEFDELRLMVAQKHSDIIDKINLLNRDVDKLQEKDKGFDIIHDRIWKIITGVLTGAIAYLFFTK